MKRYCVIPAEVIALELGNYKVLMGKPVEHPDGEWVKFDDIQAMADAYDKAISVVRLWCSDCQNMCKREDNTACKNYVCKNPDGGTFVLGVGSNFPPSPLTRFCEDCRFICKPTGAMYEPHPDSICKAKIKTINFVTRDHCLPLCKDVNTDGMCPYYKDDNS